MSDREHALELLELAKRDFTALENMLDARFFADEIFGFHAQQAVEKAIKAWIASLSLEYPISHDLRRLLNVLRSANKSVDDFDALMILQPFAVQYRYDFIEVTSSPLDRPEWIQAVAKAIDRIAKEILSE